MMEPAGRLSLPVEILHHISKFLAPKDILNTSQTCRYLRDAFNDSSVWKRFTPETVAQLKFKEPLVEPKFCLDAFSPSFCDYLILYKIKNHVFNNWKQNNFVKMTSEINRWYASGVFNVPKGRNQIIYKDTYIFLGRFTNDIESDGIDIWNIEKNPFLHSFLPIENLYYDCFYIIGSNLVVVECRRVSVYKITVPETHFPVLYSFIITGADVTWNDLALPCGQFDEVCDEHYNVGQYLLSNKCGDEGNVLHVWDILNASKVGAFVTPMEGFSVRLVLHEGDNWLLGQNTQTGNEQFYFFFNVKERTFSDSIFKYEGYAEPIIFYESHLLLFEKVETPNSAGWCDSICIVYDFNTSKEVKRRRFNNAKKNYQLRSTKVVNGTFIILCFDCFQIINALTLDTVYHFQCDWDTQFISYQFDIFGSVIVVAVGGDDFLYMWDVKDKKKLPRSLEVKNDSHLYLSESFSKLVTVGYSNLSVFHFW